MIKISIKNTESLKTKLLKLAEKYLGFKNLAPEVVVGFCQTYAIYVHELPIPHKVGQWKYLETAYRANTVQAGNTIQQAMKKGAKLEQALMMGGLLIQRAAQQLTPVDTSALKSSAFTCLKKDLEQVSREVFAKSEAIRIAGKKGTP